MKRWTRVLGSLRIAVPLLIAIAGVLAWGTFYEVRFGTAAVQRFVYQAWWFQLLLAFLAANLAIAALQRYPWKRPHLPFVLAHIGIILILIGGIIGSRFGVDGQMVIPEGEAERMLELPGNVLTLQDPSTGQAHAVPTHFETQAWVHELRWIAPMRLGAEQVMLSVDRYYPDAVLDEQVTTDGAAPNPAVQVRLRHEGHQEETWLFARDPERLGISWGQAHVLFLEPNTEAQAKQLLRGINPDERRRGIVSVKLPLRAQAFDIPVPETLGSAQPIAQTPYQITFKEYFPDFILTPQGPVSQSDAPNNPAVSLLLSGPEGADAYLLFAMHPEFQSMHGFKHQIPAEVTYTHEAGTSLPPQSIGLVQLASGELAAVLTGPEEGQREVIAHLKAGETHAHPFLGYEFTVLAQSQRARVDAQVRNRSNDVRAEMLHVTARRGADTAEAWVGLRQPVPLILGDKTLMLTHGPVQRELPVTIKLLDFRKIDYPGTQMAAGFESDVQLTDARRGVILMRKISMNEPLRYLGYSFFQSSYIDGSPQITILSVRNDPGTPVVYAGFLIVIGGVVALFGLRHRKSAKAREAEAASLKYLQEGKVT